MYKKLFIASLLYLIPSLSIAQNKPFSDYMRYVHEAEYWLYKGKPDTAYALYKHAFNIEGVKKSALELYYAAMASARTGASEDCYSFLLEVADYPLIWIKIGVLERDSSLFFSVLGAKMEQIRSKLDAISLKMKADSSRAHNESMVDWFIAGNDRLVKAQPYNEDRLNTFHASMLDYLEKTGYLGLNNTGTDILSSIFRHIKDPNYDRTLVFLHKSLKNRDLTAFEVAHFIDNYEYKLGNHKGTYGCHNFVERDENYAHKFIENRLDLGVSIFFTNPVRTPWMKKRTMDWIEKLPDFNKYFVFETVLKEKK